MEQVDQMEKNQELRQLNVDHLKASIAANQAIALEEKKQPKTESRRDTITKKKSNPSLGVRDDSAIAPSKKKKGLFVGKKAPKF